MCRPGKFGRVNAGRISRKEIDQTRVKRVGRDLDRHGFGLREETKRVERYLDLASNRLFFEVATQKSFDVEDGIQNASPCTENSAVICGSQLSSILIFVRLETFTFSSISNIFVHLLHKGLHISTTADCRLLSIAEQPFTSRHGGLSIRYRGRNCRIEEVER